VSNSNGSVTVWQMCCTGTLYVWVIECFLLRWFMKKRFEDRKNIVYEFICDDIYIPMKFKELADVLQVEKQDKHELEEVLHALVAEGKIRTTPKNKYIKSEKKTSVGVFQGNPRGFGFVITDEPGDDVFISSEDVNGAFDGDQVEYIITRIPDGKRKEGKITKVLSHGITTIVGLFEKSEHFGFVRPDNQRLQQDVYIHEGKEKGAVSGQKVIVELTSYGEKYKKPEGKVIEILGFADAPGTDILSIVKEFNLPTEFPEKVLNQGERVGKEVTKEDMATRMDLREVEMVTIDGADAKDLDDAVSLVMDGENYILGVHIADVTNYVQERSALDKEALKRGTSVYLVDRVIPMLPPKLSNGICSLNPKVDRLTLSCMMTITPKGEVIDHAIVETVVNINERMTYESVARILEHGNLEEQEILKKQEKIEEQEILEKQEKIEEQGKLEEQGELKEQEELERHEDLEELREQKEQENQEEFDKYKKYVPLFKRMEALSKILRKSRKSRGSIDFDFPEAKVILDNEGYPIDIKIHERNVATRLIEDFMLLANETVAEEYYWRELPFLYRNHEVPDSEKIRALSTFINNFGYHIRFNEEVKPMEIQKLLDKLEDSPYKMMISNLALRSMKQAKYAPENVGHFGLAAKYYTHFTSPIRRYPDLQIHRIIKENIRGRLNEERIQHYQKILTEVSLQSNTMERRAEEAERETVKLKKVEYIKDYIGETFEGVISGLTKWGIYVQLANTIEGMVHVINLADDYYEYNEQRYEMVGEATGKTYKLGQVVNIEVIGADTIRRTIDFAFVDTYWSGLESDR